VAKQLDIKVERDHLISLTNSSPRLAIAELIWNSLDADSTRVAVAVRRNAIGVESIEVSDNGNGIDSGDADRIFGTLGGSVKKAKQHSPGLREYHGKEGKGRFKAMALGSLVTFESRFNSNGGVNAFTVTWDKSNLNHPTISDVSPVARGKGAPGVTVTIENIDQEAVSALSRDTFASELEIEFAVYFLTYPTFAVTFDGAILDFRKHIRFSKVIDEQTSDGSTAIPFQVHIIEWSFGSERKMHYCSTNGVTFATDTLGIRAGTFPISVHIRAEYIEKIHRENKLQLGELDAVTSEMRETAKMRAREYVRERLQETARDYIEELKRDDLYPYKEASTSVVEDAARQVFDIVALHINECLPSFADQDKKNRQLTFALVKEALENDTSGLQKILTEVVNLPKAKVEELNDILEKTTLATMIDTFKVITDRLKVIDELRLLLFDDRYKNVVLERKHFHKIVKNETWIFGDDFTYGADDVNLKNVLKAYLKELGRLDFEDAVEHGDNSKLADIPDICLWKQYSGGKAGHHRNLIIELKRPNKVVTPNEIDQIKRYAFAVSEDTRFPRENTEWVFILLASTLNKQAEFECDQQNRKFGHIFQKEGIDIHVLLWGDVLNEAEARHQFLKDKINMNVADQTDGIELLKKKYESFLPKGITQESVSAVQVSTN
jgi:Histidine kinase-, DNA gyrase B-, and HSP90-like ATPase